jgi:hypothetical protein
MTSGDFGKHAWRGTQDLLRFCQRLLPKVPCLVRIPRHLTTRNSLKDIHLACTQYGYLRLCGGFANSSANCLVRVPSHLAARTPLQEIHVRPEVRLLNMRLIEVNIAAIIFLVLGLPRGLPLLEFLFRHIYCQ